MTLILNYSQHSYSAKVKEYIIKIEINAPVQDVWKAVTNFPEYPKWNSVLSMKNNDNLTVNQKFDVTITQANGKQSKFKANTIYKAENQKFIATQKMIGKWFFLATHHFIIEKIDDQRTLFTQKWELNGVIASLFKRSIFKQLDRFITMNAELKYYLEDPVYGTKKTSE